MNQKEWLETYYPKMVIGYTEPVACAICGKMTTTSAMWVRQYYTCSGECEKKLQEEYDTGKRQRW